jgi:hypothetical protein
VVLIQWVAIPREFAEGFEERAAQMFIFPIPLSSNMRAEKSPIAVLVSWKVVEEVEKGRGTLSQIDTLLCTALYSSL